MAPAATMANGSSSVSLLSSKSKSKSSGKSSQPSLIIKLQLSSDALSSFETNDASDSPGASKNAADKDGDNTPKRSDSGSEEKPGNSVSKDDTPALADDASAVNGEAPSRKGIPGPKPGAKRAQSGTDANGTAKPRGKPGPKKKLKLEGDSGAASAAAGHKLGPKANQGAINAGLRALDRTDKQPRKWHRKVFHLKSFTGVSWEAPLWKTPQYKGAFSKDEETSEVAGSSDAKPEHQNSGVGSETSNNVGEKSGGGAVGEQASSPPDRQPAVTASPIPA